MKIVMIGSFSCRHFCYIELNPFCVRSTCALAILLFLLSAPIWAPAQKSGADSLLRVVQLNNRDTSHVDALLLLANELTRSNTDKAKSYVFTALSLTRELDYAMGLSRCYNYLASIHQNTGNKDSAQVYLELYDELARQHPDDTRIQANYCQTRGLFLKNSGNYREALPFMLKALNYLEGQYNPGIAGQLLNIGNIYYNLGQIREAASFHLRALRLFEGLGNLRGQSFCLNSLGNDFLELNEHATARRYFQKSLEIKEQIKDTRGIGSSLTGLATVARHQKQYAKAARYLTRSLSIARELNLTQEEGKVLYEWGLVEKLSGNLAGADSLLRESLLKVRSGSDSALMATITAELIDVQQRAHTFEFTERSVNVAVQLASRAGDKSLVAQGYRNLASLYAANGQHATAYDYLLKYNALNDSIRGTDVIVQLKTIEQIYEQEKNEKEIALLKKDQELKAAVIEKQLANQRTIVLILVSVVFIALIVINRYRALNKMQRQIEIEKVRNHIARDLHDDIGSTLSSINLFSKLALGDQDDPRKYLQRIADNSSRMMESMSDIVWSINPSHDSLAQVIAKIKEFAAEILEPRGISYEIIGEEEVCAVSVDLEKRKNLFLIIKEALNNTAKYSGASEVVIRFRRVQGEVHCTVADNGSGFDLLTVKKGNGLHNMEARARAFDGAFTLVTNPLSGTRIAVSFGIT
jgi:two-component system, NarL family, sensor histidine kinase UhpB